jgi:hypothetical protein
LLCSDDKIVASDELSKGIRQLLDKLGDIAVDVPLAPKQVAEVLGSLIVAGKAELDSVARHIVEADMDPPAEGEDTMLVADRMAIKMLEIILGEIKAAWDVEKTKETWAASGLDWKQFLPREEREGATAPVDLATILS